MTDEFQNDSDAREGQAPLSSRGLSRNLSLEVPALSYLRDYEDRALLDRAYQRLSQSARRGGPHPAVRLLSVAALVAAGAVLGVSVDRQLSQRETELLAQHEIHSEGVPAGLVTEAPVRASRDGSLPRDQAQASRRSSRVNKLIPRLQESAGPAPGVADKVEPEALPAETVLLQKPEWLSLADQGDYAAAFQRLDASGGFDPVLSEGSPEELMTLAEVARSVGQPGRAIQALRVVTVRYQDDPNAPIAAMILGNLLDRTGDKAGAARAYALNRALSPGGDFAEEALVREFDMASGAGDVDRVEELRAQYEQEFPEGRHLRDMRAEEARLVRLVEMAEQHMLSDDDDDDEVEELLEQEAQPETDTSRSVSKAPADARSPEK